MVKIYILLNTHCAMVLNKIHEKKSLTAKNLSFQKNVYFESFFFFFVVFLYQKTKQKKKQNKTKQKNFNEN